MQFRTQERLLDILEANVLEGWPMRLLALTDIQFGGYFKDPDRIRPWIVDEAVKIYSSNSTLNSYLKGDSAMSHDVVRTKLADIVSKQDSITILRSNWGRYSPHRLHF